jgi:hypothetical protein
MSPSGNQWTYSYNPSQAGSYQFICIAKNPSASPTTDTCNTISRTVTAQTFCGDGSIQTPNSNGQNEECE